MMPGDEREKSSAKSLLDAIDEEVAGAGFSVPPGAKPIEAQVAKPRAEPMRERLTRIAKKPRTLVLLVLLLAVVIELAMVTWTKDASQSLEQQRAQTVRAGAAKAGSKAITQPDVPVQPEGPAQADAPETAAKPTAPAQAAPSAAPTAPAH